MKSIHVGSKQFSDCVRESSRTQSGYIVLASFPEADLAYVYDQKDVWNGSILTDTWRGAPAMAIPVSLFVPLEVIRERYAAPAVAVEPEPEAQPVEPEAAAPKFPRLSAPEVPPAEAPRPSLWVRMRGYISAMGRRFAQ
jgi:hypothetical protein